MAFNYDSITTLNNGQVRKTTYQKLLTQLDIADEVTQAGCLNVKGRKSLSDEALGALTIRALGPPRSQ